MKSAVKKIDTSGAVTEITKASMMAINGSKLYFLNAEYGNTWVELSWYDTNSATFHDESFLTLEDETNTDLSSAQTFAIDPVNKSFYFLVSNYETNGDGYVYSSDGKFVDKFDTGGLYPVRVCFLTN